MTDLATLKTRLDEAETALHALHTGQRSVELRYADGKAAQFQSGDAARLEQYIAGLRRQIARAEGTLRRNKLIFTG